MPNAVSSLFSVLPPNVTLFDDGRLFQRRTLAEHLGSRRFKSV
jgi:hypothetical protein